MRTSRTTRRRIRHSTRSSILVNMIMMMSNPFVLCYCIFSFVATTTTRNSSCYYTVNAQQEGGGGGGGLMLGTHYTDADLEKMTIIELERICLDRGFEVVQDDSSILVEGKEREEGDYGAFTPPPPLSHDDYVDAAKRCLAIEKEMNDLLDEYPELAREFEEEFARMKQEQEELERQIQQQSEQLGINVGGEEEEESSSSSSETSSAAKSNTINEESSSSENEQETATTTTTTASEKEERVDLSLQALTSDIIKGFIAQVKKDVKRIVDLMVPVLQPILRVGGMLWRQLRAIIESLLLNKKQQKRNDDNSSSSQGKEQQQQQDEQDNTDQR